MWSLVPRYCPSAEVTVYGATGLSVGGSRLGSAGVSRMTVCAPVAGVLGSAGAAVAGSAAAVPVRVRIAAAAATQEIRLMAGPPRSRTGSPDGSGVASHNLGATRPATGVHEGLEKLTVPATSRPLCSPHQGCAALFIIRRIASLLASKSWRPGWPARERGGTVSVW